MDGWMDLTGIERKGEERNLMQAESRAGKGGRGEGKWRGRCGQVVRASTLKPVPSSASAPLLLLPDDDDDDDDAIPSLLSDRLSSSSSFFFRFFSFFR